MDPRVRAKQAILAQETLDGGRNVLARRQFNCSLRGGSCNTIAFTMHRERLCVFKELAHNIEGGALRQLETGTYFFHAAFDPARPTLMVISGTHGVEGYAGQDVQNAVLRQLVRQLEGRAPASYNLIMVHGLNNWGMQHGQRFTDEKIDLNRNFWDKKPHNPHYTQGIEDAIQAAKGREPNWLTKAILLCKFAFHGIWPWDVKSHIMRGQYAFPQGFEYGGQERAKEHAAVSAALKALVGDQYAQPVAIIDLHTGVGPPARASSPENSFILIVDDEEQRRLLENALQHHSRLRARISQGGGKRAYHVTGSCMSGYGRFFQSMNPKGPPPLLVTQEFATADVVDIFTTLITNGNKPNDSIIPLFYYDKPWWRTRTTEDGVALYNAVAGWVAKQGRGGGGDSSLPTHGQLSPARAATKERRQRRGR